MSRDILILREDEIRSLLDPMACIQAVENAFSAYSGGRAELPGVIHLDVPENRGEIHIKAGHIRGGTHYAVKIVSGFPGNPALGLSANDGLVAVFDSRTGAPAAILFDNGLITDLRTGAAGAVAAKHLAVPEANVLAVIGAGGQARYQAEMIGLVRGLKEVRIWGRDPVKATGCAQHLRNRPALSACRVVVTGSVHDAVNDAEIVVTVTAAREPVVHADSLKSGVTVIAVGADSPHKRELDPGVLARADRIIADSIPQCLRLGEIHHAVESGAISKEDITAELGEITAKLKPGRSSAAEMIVCDLTGIGVQDVAAASLVMARAAAASTSNA
jgi:ornithine cyclodeaminase